MTTAIVCAAGSSTRMAAALKGSSKLLFQLTSGNSVLSLSLSALYSANIARFVVVLGSDEADKIKGEALSWKHRVAPSIDLFFVQGGETRQMSVYNALLFIEKHKVADNELIAIHDAARPFCPIEVITNAVYEAARSGAAVPAMAEKNTLKVVSATNKVIRTIPREQIFEAQTPQVFNFALILKAHREALAHGYCGTDDAELVELLGESVTITPGSDRNLKLTTPDDLVMLKALLNLTAN